MSVYYPVSEVTPIYLMSMKTELHLYNTPPYLPGSSFSRSRLLFFLSASSGCPDTVADDDTTSDTLPVLDGGTMPVPWDDISPRLPLPTVVVGDTILDVTEVAPVAMVTRGSVDNETAPTTEATGVLVAVDMVT